VAKRAFELIMNMQVLHLVLNRILREESDHSFLQLITELAGAPIVSIGISLIWQYLRQNCRCPVLSFMFLEAMVVHNSAADIT